MTSGSGDCLAAQTQGQVITKRRVFLNAIMATVQVVVTGLSMIILFRFLLDTIGIDKIGIWSLVLATTNVTRISELGFANSALLSVSRYLAKGDSPQAAQVIETAAITVAGFSGIVLLALYAFLQWGIAQLVPSAALAEALTLLPYAVGSLWCSIVASTVHSGLDGIQRADLRSLLLISSQLVLLGGVVLWVPSMGLEGVALAQLIQSLWGLLIGWATLRWKLKGLSLAPFRWSRRLFLEMFSYAANFQLNGVVQLLFEPTTKALLSRWGSLADVGYFEMANRLILQIRSLLVAGNQVMVPVVTTQNERSPSSIAATYTRCYDIMLYVAVPMYSLVFILIPLISEVWIGQYEPTFVTFVFLLMPSWALNTATVPAYLAFVGIGRLRWNTISHMLMGITNLLLGYILGHMFGSIGVIVGTCVALLVGSLVTLVPFHAEHHVDLHCLAPQDSRGLVAWSIFGVGGGLFVYYLLHDAVALWIVAVLVCGLFLGLVSPSMWRHRIRTFLVDGIRELCYLR